APRPPRPGDHGAVWLVAPTNAPGPVRLATETDSGLAVTALPSESTPLLFGPGIPGPLVTADSAPAVTPIGSGAVRLTGAWRRFAIAWTIQSWGLVRGESNGKVLLWRRDVTERLQRLAPFARFGAATPVLRNGALWWVSWGYVSHDAFPLVRPLPWREEQPRFLRAGIVGAVRVATGETHLWLAPDRTLWTAVGFETGLLMPKRFVGLAAAAITPRGAELHLWRPSAGDPPLERLPGELVGSSLLRPGPLRVWPVGKTIITVQAQIL